jgi:hypothetical protein
VTNFDADPTGNADSTTAIQTALNRAKALGGGVVYLPPGDFKVSAPLALASATGVSLRGAGLKATTLIMTSGTSNVLEMTSCTGFTFEGFAITSTGSNVASAIVMTGCTYVIMRSVLVDNSGGGSFLIPVILTASSANVRMDDCDLYPTPADATARTVRITDSSDVVMTGGYLRENAGAAVEFAGSTQRVTMLGVRCVAGASGSPKGLLWSATSTGQDFTVVGCLQLRSGVGLYAVPFDMSAISTDPRLRQYGNGMDGYAENVTSGGTVTPNRSYGADIRYTGTTTGVAYVVAAPIPTPAAGATSGMRDTLLRLTFNNAAGGAVTGWSLNAAYHLASATPTISTTNLDITVVTFQWDATASVWREISRAVTA